MIQTHVNTYRQEVMEHLDNIEETVLDLEQEPDNKDLMNSLFRSVHTIKGSGAMFGFDDLVGFTHHLETVLEHVRSDQIQVSNKLVNLTLAAIDHIKAMISDEKNPLPNEIESRCEIINQLQSLLPESAENENVFERFCKDIFDIPEIEYEQQDKPGKAEYNIEFVPHTDIMKNGTEPAFLFKELSSLGEYNITPDTGSIPVLGKLIPEQCYLSWNINLNTVHDINTVKDIFIFVEEKSRVSVTPVNKESSNFKESSGEIIIQNKTRDINEQSIKNKDIKDSTTPHKEIPKKESKSIRVMSEKLDLLMNLVGELVVTQAAISQSAETVSQLTNIEVTALGETLERFEQELYDCLGIRENEDIEHENHEAAALFSTFAELKHNLLKYFKNIDKLHNELTGPAENLDRLTREFKNCVLDIRMVPIGTIFGKFRRLVRDLSKQLEKEIVLLTRGDDTEIDKTIIEGLNDPLIHLIRNSIDHGISTPGTRRKYGKDSKAEICLEAAHKGDRIEISIKDDGMGIDTDVIKAKAVLNNLVAPDAVLDEQEIFDLIFTPGFSTSEKITDVSGRGVGMDVVKRQIEALGGKVRIESEKGSFTKVILSLPLTLAIIDGLLISVNKRTFILPLVNIFECMEIDNNASDNNMILVRGKMIPFIRLRELFDISGEPPPIQRIVIVETDNTRIGIVADKIIGNIQTTIKSLGNTYNKQEFISGASVMGDGSISLIIDISGLICSTLKNNKYYNL